MSRLANHRELLLFVFHALFPEFLSVARQKVIGAEIKNRH